MLKQGKQLGITPIKCEQKEGTDKLKDLHYRINDILYSNSGKYIDKALAQSLYGDLCGLGVELDALEVPERARAKKTELLGKLRTVCMNLKDYRKQPQTIEDTQLMQAAINWVVHLCIDAKEKNELTPEKVLELLKETKRVYEAFKPFEEHLKTDTLIKLNGELVNNIDTNLGIRH
jgi:hypothetical protein